MLKLSRINGVVIAATVLAGSLVLAAGAPAGWYISGSKPADYESGIDAQAQYSAHPSAYLKSRVAEIDGFGPLMQNFRADQYAGKRLRLKAFVKTEGVQEWAGLWMNSVKLEPVGVEVPTTGSGTPQDRNHPTNLDFESQ
jgi:hypothetical protein